MYYLSLKHEFEAALNEVQNNGIASIIIIKQ